MNGKEKHSPIRKYLEAKEFVEYCKANNVEASIYILEAYEKAGLLSPIYRLVAPDDYICALFEYNHSNSFNPNIPFDKDNKWLEIKQLITALSNYSFKPLPQFSFALIHGHPLDYAYLNKNQFLKKPSKEDFKPWEEYRIVAGTIDGHPAKEETVEHYYTPWQIFVLDELNLIHTIEENYATKQKKGWDIFKQELYTSKLIGFYEYFQTISNFKMMESLIWLDITFGVKSSVIEGESLEKLMQRTAEVATIEYEKQSYADWIRFIRRLTELYNKYIQREKIRLSDEIKRFLASTVIMIRDATKKSFAEVCEDYDGRFKGFMGQGIEDGIFIYPGELERIFPDELKQIKERAWWALDSYIKAFNDALTDEYKIDLRIKDTLIDNIIENGHELLLSHLYEIEYLWFNRRIHWEGSILAHLRSFAVSIESIGQEWFGGRYLTNILEDAFKKEYASLRDSIGIKITDAETPSEYKQKLNKILVHREKSQSGICGCHLVVANLTRNYFAHKVKFESDMLGSLFIEVYKGLLLTLISLFIQKVKLSGCGRIILKEEG